ncbi:Mu transposase C-terminal domain-containing protein [Castellaniella sp. GW247-6E4]|uniref:Mu transposase C-terminal domain-containing protein n=1 Tax=Castellaniella sp. GW247-6E4 TaxID=3140380 RepID=UPI003315E651
MLFKNDVFLIEGTRVRLLHVNALADTACVISLDEALAWPVWLPYSEIRDLPVEPAPVAAPRKPTPAQTKYCDAAWERISPLVEADDLALFEPTSRKLLISARAAQLGCSPTTIYKALRRYWQRGQTKHALMPDFDHSGRPGAGADANCVAITAGRGRKPKSGTTYQLTSRDAEIFHRVIKQEYLADARKTIVDAFTVLSSDHYRFVDGNGQRCLLAPGERPTIRQFRRFLLQHYGIEVRIRAREGDKDYEREHRRVLGSYLADCQGVGHYYEIDATIADVYLVASGDVQKIIGKPTLYLITDRKSDLIVGFYFGLENASWTGARQAILSITEDKSLLCERYGVKYDPADWPADRVFPQEFVGDRGEMISQMSTKVAEGLEITVTNPPAQRPDWKSTVECGFRQFHCQIRPVTPAYDPPSNATRRRGKHYERDACLTIQDFGKIVLEAIIAHNRREMPGYALSNQELMDGVSPSPIALWEHGIRTRAGLLTRYDEPTVRFALLPEKDAVVTERGIEFEGSCYSCPEAISGSWFERARKKRFRVRVSYDPRLVDQLYVHQPDEKAGPPMIASLTERSREYRGYSFGEVAYFEALRAEVLRNTEQSRLANSIDFRDATRDVVAAAKARLKSSGRKKSRSARRADTVQARTLERTGERKLLAAINGAKPPASVALIQPQQGMAYGAPPSALSPGPGQEKGREQSGGPPQDHLEALLEAEHRRMWE